ALDARLSKLSYQGLEAGVEGVEHGKAGRDLSASYKDAPLEHIIKDETPNFRKLQPILEQVTVPINYELGAHVFLARCAVRFF
ncbi:hypothetical protein Tco_0279477, partial [Tanacetum coccineum]